MGKSIWTREIELGLLEHIKKVFKGSEFEDINITLRTPEEDFKIEVYPSITLYNLYNVRDEIRYNSNMQIVNKDFETKNVIKSFNTIPYNLYYQIDFWTTNYLQMSELTKKWIGYHPFKYFNFDLLDTQKEIRNTIAFKIEDLINTKVIKDENRVFHSIIQYKIWGELNETPNMNVPMITDINIDIMKGV